jgi:hypothetical protein
MKSYTVQCPPTDEFPNGKPPCGIGIFEYSKGQWHAQIYYASGKGPQEGPFVEPSEESAFAKAVNWGKENLCDGNDPIIKPLPEL